MLGPKKGRNASLVNFKHLLKQYPGKGVKVQLLRDEILKLTHLLKNKLFKYFKHAHASGGKKPQATFNCCWKGGVIVNLD